MLPTLVRVGQGFPRKHRGMVRQDAMYWQAPALHHRSAATVCKDRLAQTDIEFIVIRMADITKDTAAASQDIVDDSLCPISRATQLIGDRWTLLVLRELSMGNVRFDPLLVQTGATRQMLASRLKRLTANGLAQRVAYQSGPVRYEYRLTPKGWAFTSVLLALRAWGETWCKAPGEPSALLTKHRDCGGEVGLDGHCESCGMMVAGTALLASPSPEYSAERLRRAQSRHSITG